MEAIQQILMVSFALPESASQVSNDLEAEYQKKYNEKHNILVKNLEAKLKHSDNVKKDIVSELVSVMKKIKILSADRESLNSAETNAEMDYCTSFTSFYEECLEKKVI